MGYVSEIDDISDALNKVADEVIKIGHSMLEMASSLNGVNTKLNGRSAVRIDEIKLEELLNSCSFPDDMPPRVDKDLKKVQFDFENFEYSAKDCRGTIKELMGYCTLENGLTFLGCYAGGDWENPVFFIIYYDGKDLRGYIPKDGNVYNLKTKKAFGNAEDEEDEDDDPDFDSQKIKADILKRISVE